MKKPINYKAYVDIINRWVHSDDDMFPEELEPEELVWVINTLGKENAVLRQALRKLIMGEISDDVIEGFLCQCCCCPMPDWDSPGYPRTCPECEKEDDENDEM